MEKSIGFIGLVEYLNSIETGEIKDTIKLANLFSPCWDEFDGSTGEGMEAEKL